VLGSGLMKSHRFTQLSYEGGQCFIMEFTDEQAKKIAGSTMAAGMFSTRPVRRAEQQVIEVDAPTFDVSGPMDTEKEITGSIVVRGLDQLKDEKIQLRIAFREGEFNGTATNTYTLHPGMSRLRFKYRVPPNQVRSPKPTVVFMDICRAKKDEDTGFLDVEVLSNTVAMILEFQGGPEKPDVQIEGFKGRITPP
jgi:hypothetical protein